MPARAASRCLRRLSLWAWTIGFGLLERGAFLREFRSLRKVLSAIEVDIAVDERRINTRVDAEWMSIPNRDVSILSDFNRTNALLNAELDRWIERDEFERLFFGQVAPVHRFCGFDVQTSRSLIGIGVH